MATRLFESDYHAELYSKYRPKYGKSVSGVIIDFCKTGICDFDLAVDVGCGSGQSTSLLCSAFKNVIGSDVSPNQIENASKNLKNVTFLVSPAEDLGFLSNNSTDLITISQAIHWVDTTKFYKEVTRVLKPGGSLVVYGYGFDQLDKEDAQMKLDRFYFETIAEFWSNKIQLLQRKYEDITLPFDGWIRKDDLEIAADWSVDEFIGFVASSSAWQSYLKVNPSSEELKQLSNRFREIYTRINESGVEEEQKMHITWPVFMLMAHKLSSL
ncbi:hypothetical protein SNE40_002660 [Patella caerulea]|uniref:Methyltransferase type 11 domain-containing protein n=1 Tax=Patella caerulea TaxID=87958 RepID=A0AAN8KCN2_PATCE